MKILQFSGGIDSLACLLLLRDEPDLTVVTITTDGVYTSTLEYLSKLHGRFPTLPFVVRRTDRKLPEYGQPVDVVPLRWTAVGQLARGTRDVRYQDFVSCCQRAIWIPLDELSRELGATVIYRGQRIADELKAPITDGHVDRGVTIRFPIADWSREKVFRYVMDFDASLIPPGYKQDEKTSRDCWDCTAYLKDNEQRIDNLPVSQHGHVIKLLHRWEHDVAVEMRN